MARFQLLGSTPHDHKGTVIQPGEVFETELNLIEMFPNKWVQVVDAPNAIKEKKAAVIDEEEPEEDEDDGTQTTTSDEQPEEDADAVPKKKKKKKKPVQPE